MTFPKPPATLVGQLVEHAPVHTVQFDLGSTPPPAEFRLFTGLFGPAVANANTGAIIFGVVFQVTAAANLVGYSQWCCNSGMDTNPLNYACWHLTAGGPTGTVLAGSVVTGGTLTQGAFNDTFLPSPVALTPGSTYVAQMGLVNGFPVTTGFWSTTGVGYRGIVNGPLEAFSEQGASNPAPFTQPQNSFAPGTSDPTTGIGPNGNAGFNEWLDVLISTA